MKKKTTLADRLQGKLRKLGLSEKKAKAFAKGLMPLLRHAMASATVKEIERQVDAEPVVSRHSAITKGRIVGDKAIKVNGHSLRFDLPVAPMKGVTGIELLRVMDGLSSEATYLVAAVKSDRGIVAIRQFISGGYNVKFYPTMAYWGKTHEELTDLGGSEFLQREHYERCHVTRDGLDRVLTQLALDAKPKSRMKALMDRFLTVATTPLVKAFGYLHQKYAAA